MKNSDQQQLKAVFSERMQKGFDAEGWDKVLPAYQKHFKKEFGDYKLADFTFKFKAYEGKEGIGGVSINHKGKDYGDLRVIKEKTGWKMHER